MDPEVPGIPSNMTTPLVSLGESAKFIRERVLDFASLTLDKAKAASKIVPRILAEPLARFLQYKFWGTYDS